MRRALTQLPCRAAIAEVSERAAERCAEAQVRAHAAPALGRTQLKQWAKRNAVPTGLQWREFLAGAVSSGLALHALIAAAADPRTTREQALAIDEVYLSVCALTTLLDSLIDYEQDRSMGQPGYIRYYEDRDALAQGLRSVIHRAAARARDTPNGAYHLMTLVGVVAYYSSAPTASSEFARPVTEQIRRELRPIHHTNARGHARLANRQASPNGDHKQSGPLMRPGAAAHNGQPLAGSGAPCRDHRRRQRPLGAFARATLSDGHNAGADTLKARLRDAVEFGIRGADRVLILHRELVATRRGGPGPDLNARTAHRQRDPRTPPRGSTHALHRPPQRSAQRAPRADTLG